MQENGCMCKINHAVREPLCCSRGTNTLFFRLLRVVPWTKNVLSLMGVETVCHHDGEECEERQVGLLIHILHRGVRKKTVWSFHNLHTAVHYDCAPAILFAKQWIVMDFMLVISTLMLAVCYRWTLFPDKNGIGLFGFFFPPALPGCAFYGDGQKCAMAEI